MAASSSGAAASSAAAAGAPCAKDLLVESVLNGMLAIPGHNVETCERTHIMFAMSSQPGKDGHIPVTVKDLKDHKTTLLPIMKELKVAFVLCKCRPRLDDFQAPPLANCL